MGGKAILASSARSADDRTGRGVAAGACTTSTDAGDNYATGNYRRFIGVFTDNGPGTEPENHSFCPALIG